MGAGQLATAVESLRDAFASAKLPLDLPGVDALLADLRSAVQQTDDYLLPRLLGIEAPLLCVVGGSTGAGKSTLVNSVIARRVSATGVLRPTTRSPVLLHHPGDADWFAAGRVLSGFARSSAPSHDPKSLQLVAEPTLPKGLAILDAPDIDSVVAQNRALAGQLLAAADLWLFVTSAARYADAVPWEYLRSAARRRAVVAVVLDRVPPAAQADVPADLGRLMVSQGLADSPLFAVPETAVDANGLLPDGAVAPIRDWLWQLAGNHASRRSVVVRTLAGALDGLAGLAPRLDQSAAEQREALETLRHDAEESWAMAAADVSVQSADGTLLRGEVLARWQDFVGTGELLRAVEQKVGWLRDRVVSALTGRNGQAIEVKAAVGSGLEVLIAEAVHQAAARTASAWQAHPAGRQLLATATRDLARAQGDADDLAARAVRGWQGDVLTLVSEIGAKKRSTARFWALGVNGAGVALMILVFSQTGGLAGAELGIAGGTALVAQRVLEAVFGDDAVRRLARQAKEDLDARVEALMATQLADYFAEVDLVEQELPEPLGEALTTEIISGHRQLLALPGPGAAEVSHDLG